MPKKHKRGVNSEIDYLLSKKIKGDFYKGLKDRNKLIIKLYIKKFDIVLPNGAKVTDMTTVYITREPTRLRLKGTLNGSDVTLYTLSKREVESDNINVDEVQADLGKFLACIRQLSSCYELKRMEHNIRTL
jgi:hypothetical protein